MDLKLLESMGKSEAEIAKILGISRTTLWKRRGEKREFRSDKGRERVPQLERMERRAAYMRAYRRKIGLKGGKRGRKGIMEELLRVCSGDEGRVAFPCLEGSTPSTPTRQIVYDTESV